MKKVLNIIIALSAIFLLANCKKESGLRSDNEKLPVISIDEKAITKTSADISFSESDLGYPIAAFVISKSDYYSIDRSERIDSVNILVSEFAQAESKSVEEYIAEHIIDKAKTLVFNNLKPSTSYTVQLYKVENGKLAGPQLNPEFFFATKSAYTSMRIDVNYVKDEENKTQKIVIMPEFKDVPYFFTYMESGQLFFFKYLRGLTDEQVLVSNFRSEFSDSVSKQKATTIAEKKNIFDGLMTIGDKEIEIKTPESQLNLTFLLSTIKPIKEDYYNFELASPLSNYEFTIDNFKGNQDKPLKTIDVKFTIEKEEDFVIKSYSAYSTSFDDITIQVIQITPELESYTADQLADYIIENRELTERDFNVLPDGQNVKLLPGSKYALVSFTADIYNKKRTSNAVMQVIETPDFSINTEILAKGPHFARFKLTPSHNNIFYTYVLETGKSIEEVKNLVQGLIDSGIRSYKAQNPDGTSKDYLSNMYLSGATTRTANFLDEDTAYDFFPVGIDDDGQVISIKKFDAFVHTKPVSTAGMTVLETKVFSGDEAYINKLISDPTARARAIVYVKFEVNSEAKDSYSYLASALLDKSDLDRSKVTDAYVLEKLSPRNVISGRKVIMLDSHTAVSFMMADWNTKQTLYYWSVDANKEEGAVKRMAIDAPRMIYRSPISELKQINDELQAATSGR